MSLLRDIQNAAVDTNTDIAALLRKCKILAARLGNYKFKEWIDFELNGYPNKDHLPKYRILGTKSFGTFCGPFGSGANNAPIPPMCLPEEFREYVTTSYLTAPVSSYVELLSSPDNNPVEQWPADMIAHFGQKIYQNMNCVSAWKTIPRNSIAAILDTIKTRILDFVLEIENEAPDAGEASPNSPPIAQDKVTHIFNTYISGNVQNVAAGSSHVSQNSDIHICQNDFTSLYDFLKSEGVSHDDLIDLEKAVQDDAQEHGKRTKGHRVQQWTANMINKAASGAWNVTKSVATNILSKALASYFGF